MMVPRSLQALSGRRTLRALCLAAFFLLVPAGAFAITVDTKATHAFMIDYDTGAVLLDKEGTTPMHPSSMTKLMTTYILKRRLREGRVALTDTFRVSEKAWKMQGSKMFVHVGDDVPMEDLLRGIIVQSGNDACIVVAEGLSGSEEAFAGEMNRVGKEIGLTGSHFTNATGWPDDNHTMTARDLATLAERVIRDFPERYAYYAETSFTYNGITQPNRNRLLGNDIGVDGLKTGHTEVAGYGITLSAKDPKSGRRLILVVNGLASDNARVEEGDRLLRWGLREFVNRTVARAGEAVDSAPVWFGEKDAVPFTVEKDAIVTLPANTLQEARLTLRYTGPLPAPVAKGARVAELVVTAPGQEGQVIPLVAAEDVAALGGLRKAWRTLQYLIFKTGQPSGFAATP